MRTVAVLSLKGGVGKTSVVLGLAGAALKRGVRTLVVDLDPQGNCTATLDPDATTATLADVLADPSPAVLVQAIAPSAWGPEVDVLVGAEEAEAHNRPDPDTARLWRLQRALAGLDGMYRLVLVDCPPSLGQLTRSALVAADGALLVTEPTIYANTGIQRAVEAVETEHAHNPGLRPVGVVVNRIRARSAEHEYRIAELRELFGDLVLPTMLPDRSAVQHAQGAAQPIQQWSTPGAREMARRYDELLVLVAGAALDRE
ncbi:MAG: ParA family protein [Pseudonocardiaceae bacterium]